MLRSLAAQYIAPGKAQVVYRHFAFIGQESQLAAEASECANEQGKFWEYSRYLFDHQAGENRGQFGKSNLKLFAAQIGGLDVNAFNGCFDSGRNAARVRDETEEGKRRGVRATPSFFINGKFMEGLPEASQFGAMIEAQLKSK